MKISEIVRNINSGAYRNCNPVKIGDTTITLRVPKTDRNRGKVHVVNKENPHGFFVYSDGDVCVPSEIDDILPSLSEKEQDLWAINTFGVFR